MLLLSPTSTLPWLLPAVVELFAQAASSLTLRSLFPGKLRPLAGTAPCAGVRGAGEMRSPQWQRRAQRPCKIHGVPMAATKERSIFKPETARQLSDSRKVVTASGQTREASSVVASVRHRRLRTGSSAGERSSACLVVRMTVVMQLFTLTATRGAATGP